MGSRNNNSSSAKNCRICGKMFTHSHNDICPECIAKDEEDFQKIRLFLKEFPGTKIDVVEEYTGVSRKKILKYLKEERLEITDEAVSFLKCSKCGKPITKGTYCSDCYMAFTKEINILFPTEQKDNVKPKMHTKINRP